MFHSLRELFIFDGKYNIQQAKEFNMLPKGNMQQLMKQAQQMQKKMEDAQKELEAKEVTGTAGGGMVTVVATGKKTLKSIKIEPEILKEDPEMVEDLIVAAVNQAMQQVDELTQNTLGGITGGMNIPGF
jgi:DNA-binding YbaB/EbfC family protein